MNTITTDLTKLKYYIIITFGSVSKHKLKKAPICLKNIYEMKKEIWMTTIKKINIKSTKEESESSSSKKISSPYSSTP